MTNDTDSVSGVDSPSLRAILASDSATHSDANTELSALISSYDAAREAYCEAARAEDALRDAYDDAHPMIIVPILLGGGIGIGNGYEDCRKHIVAAYENQRKGLLPLSRVAPELADQARAVMDAKEIENMTILDQVFAEEKARQEAAGLPAAKRRYEQALAAESAAALALCSYPCKSLEDVRGKAGFIMTSPVIDELTGECLLALVGSFAASDSLVA